MKAELINGILHLRGETDEERAFLKKAYNEGIRNFGGGSHNVLCLPSEAELVQIHVPLQRIIDEYRDKMENYEDV